MKKLSPSQIRALVTIRQNGGNIVANGVIAGRNRITFQTLESLVRLKQLRSCLILGQWHYYVYGRVDFRKRKTWIESEVQGHGRRFWFKTVEEADRFHKEKIALGKPAVHDVNSVTVWVGFSRNADYLKQRAGIDT